MKRFLFLALLLGATAGLNVQCTTSHASETYSSDSAPRDITERSLKINKSFTDVSVKQGVKVIYTVGSANTVRIVGSEEIVDRTVVTVDGGTLKIYIDRNNNTRFKNNNGPTVYVTAPVFRSISMSSGAVVTMESPISIKDDFSVKGSSGAIFNSEKGLTCGTLDVDPSSGCIVKISSLNAAKANLSASSGAIVSLYGNVNTLTAHLSSGAIAKLADLSAKEGSVHASSGAIVNVKKGSLSVHSSSGAIVRQK